MTGIIKYRDASKKGEITNIDSFQHSDMPSLEKADENLLALEIQVTENQRLRDELEQAKANAAVAIEEAKKEARKEAEKTFKYDEEAKLASLKEGLISAENRLEAQLISLEKLSLALTKTSLEKVFCPHSDYQEQVARMVVRQLKDIRSNTVLSIHVSSEDFPDKSHLDQLSETLSDTSLVIHTDRELPSGSSRIDLQIGQLEFSAPQYWEALRLMLEEISSDEVQS